MSLSAASFERDLTLLAMGKFSPVTRDHCETKKRFPLKSMADAVALSAMNHPVKRRRSGKPIRTYQCPACDGWHLTSKK